MITKALPSLHPTLLQVYLAWVDAWCSISNGHYEPEPTEEIICLDDIGSLFNEENLNQLITHSRLIHVIYSFQQHVRHRSVRFGGPNPPSCEETNLISESYNPQVTCMCETINPSKQTKSQCNTLLAMQKNMEKVISRQDEWHSTGLFTPAKLRLAVDELVNSNTDLQPESKTCQGSPASSHVPTIKAPDRRPNPLVDSNPRITNQIYQTTEQLKICTDAKYFGVVACGASLSDEGLARAVADSCNHILIGDYCEAADANGLKLLQQVGAAVMAFLKVCNLAGRVTNWQFENLAASIVQCRVLGYYRDHSRGRLHDGVYGSRMTGLGVHRHIDVAAFHGVMTASLGTGMVVEEGQYERIVEAVVFINDFVDIRGDTLRKQRENVILRGLRGDLCRYLDRSIGECLDVVADVIEESEIGALVVMGFCNWAIMSSHHKVYELVKGASPVRRYGCCEYTSLTDNARYERVVEALRPYRTLGVNSPSVQKKRIEMDKTYDVCRQSPELHLSWRADAARILLEPTTLRQIVDMVHFEWSGDVGVVDYCP